MSFKLRLLTFDVKDTLLRIVVSPAYQYAEVARSYGARISDADVRKAYRKSWDEKQKLHPVYGVHHGISTKDWWRDFVRIVFVNAGYSATQSQHDKIFETLWSSYGNDSNYELVSNARETLEYLKGSGVKLGVVSNFDERLDELLRAKDLIKYFDFVVTSWSARTAKPDPEIFNHALRIGNASANASGHIGDDVESDYFAPRKIGMTSFLFAPEVERKAETINDRIDKRFIVRDLLELKRLVNVNAKI